MASKYDQFWERQRDPLGELINDAAVGRQAAADFSSIATVGRRKSWAGSATVRGSSWAKASMAHMVALARFAAAAGLCESWPDQTFVFSMTPRCRLIVRTDPASESSHGTRQARSQGQPAVLPRRRHVITDVQPVDATRVCEAIHAAVMALPTYTSPNEVPFANGLYFFFEVGEDSPHGRPRIIRIGNHPRTQGRLVGRLREHYATRPNAKNGSVFRRYIGGALLRRDGIERCLAPGPGLGHWESGTGLECETCVGYEERVTSYLRSSLKFACVRIDDQQLRNHLERRLIASVAQCEVCRPSVEWLGSQAYSGKVRSSGVWNSDHVNGPVATDADIATFRRLATMSANAERDLSDALLLIPCSASKRLKDPVPMAPRSISDFLSPDAATVLAEGRLRAFARKGVRLDRASAPIAALGCYSGQPYKTEGVVSGLRDAIARGLHVMILSGAYGLLRAEEPIHDYNAHISTTLSVWRSRIPIILRDYVTRNGIARAFGTFSRDYGKTVPDHFAEEDWRGVPCYAELGSDEPAVSVVPQRVAQLVLQFLEDPGHLREGWIRT
jgi:hypothetical protein